MSSDRPQVEGVLLRPAPALQPYVDRYVGYRMSGLGPGTHAGLPSTTLTFILSFDDPLDMAAMPDPGQSPGRWWSVVGGLHRSPATIRHDGTQHGIQVELTPAAARHLFAMPASASVAVLAEELGWSRRHLGARFRAEFGLTPVEVRRIARFERARSLVATQLPLVEVAAAAGYADQAHLTREWRAFTGMTPRRWIESEVFPSVQDHEPTQG